MARQPFHNNTTTHLFTRCVHWVGQLCLLFYHSWVQTLFPRNKGKQSDESLQEDSSSASDTTTPTNPTSHLVGDWETLKKKYLASPERRKELAKRYNTGQIFLDASSLGSAPTPVPTKKIDPPDWSALHKKYGMSPKEREEFAKRYRTKLVFLKVSPDSSPTSTGQSDEHPPAYHDHKQKGMLTPSSRKLVLAKITPQMSSDERLQHLRAALKAQGITVVDRPRPDSDTEGHAS